MPQDVSTPVSDKAASQAAENQNVYVLRLAGYSGAVPTARFEGHYEIRNRCLAFRMGDDLYLPSIGTTGEVRLSGETLSVGSRIIKLNTPVILVGAAVGRESLEGLAEPPPSECDWPILRA